MIAYAAAADVAKSLLAKINEVILFPLITLMMVIALVIFLYGCFQYVRDAGSSSEREEGRKHILWGVVGMFIMLSAYGILAIAAATFDLDDELRASDSRSVAPLTSTRPAVRPSTVAPTTSSVPPPRPDILPADPVAPVVGTLVCNYDESCLSSGEAGQLNRGIAGSIYLTANNTPIFSRVDGTVQSVGENGSILIKDQNGVELSFAGEISPAVKVGDVVAKGSVIARTNEMPTYTSPYMKPNQTIVATVLTKEIFNLDQKKYFTAGVVEPIPD